jgi:hypothetical protein
MCSSITDATTNSSSTGGYVSADITTIHIRLRLPTNLYKAAQAICTLCGYDNFEEYLHDVIMQDVKMELDGGGRLALTMIDDDNKKKLLGGCD